MLLPCQNDPGATAQVNPAIDLLRNLDSKHPDVLSAHGVEPADYHSKLVFRSAIESIRGTYIASSLTQRQGLVANVFETMKQMNLIAEYQLQGAAQRFDFQVMLTSQPKEMVAVEVKGGEGNSINISERPLWANEFILWCHLDGAIVNQPSHGAAAIIFNRVENEMVKRGKHVDVVVFRDARCNTPLRPCPKYKNKPPTTVLGVAPDIFLLPRAIPTEDDPEPKSHDLNNTQLPAKILAAYGVAPGDFDEHIWQVNIALVKDDKGRILRETKVYHKGKMVEWRKPRR
ncbi:MAG: hypothetical protein NTZ04_02465 [Chloroflexi bacterium]|nr:hypothetical protein [Chloroflexota bacterium]